jgi:NADH dehydrogenase [ubiquinone] 1 alpha subcomplex assembly factor 7
MILEKIKKKKILPLDQYIDFCLYKFKQSYYQKKTKFGHGGDFVTSPHVSSIFSEMIAIWIILFWNKIKKPKTLNILELGPGDGTMGKDIISSLGKINFFKSKVNYYFLEKSKSLKKIQKKNLKNEKNIYWIDNLKEFEKKDNLIILGNEFFDALPVKQFGKRGDSWFEKYVFFNKKKQLSFVFKKTKLESIRKIEKIYNLKINKFIEYPPILEKLIKNISDLLKNKNSIFLTIDYGEESRICNDTVQAIYKNKKSNILQNAGESDITYQVNFFHLIKLFKKNKLHLVEFTTQSNFLQKLGIKERAANAKKNLKKNQQLLLDSALKRLLHPLEMGSLFKVLIISNQYNTDFKYDI